MRTPAETGVNFRWLPARGSPPAGGRGLGAAPGGEGAEGGGWAGDRGLGTRSRAAPPAARLGSRARPRPAHFRARPHAYRHHLGPEPHGSRGPGRAGRPGLGSWGRRRRARFPEGRGPVARRPRCGRFAEPSPQAGAPPSPGPTPSGPDAALSPPRPRRPARPLRSAPRARRWGRGGPGARLRGRGRERACAGQAGVAGTAARWARVRGLRLQPFARSPGSMGKLLSDSLSLSKGIH